MKLNIPIKAHYKDINLSLGLKHGHDYEIIIKDKGDYGYLICANFDYTDNVECEIYCPMSSQRSILFAWELENEEN